MNLCNNKYQNDFIRKRQSCRDLVQSSMDIQLIRELCDRYL